MSFRALSLALIVSLSGISTVIAESSKLFEGRIEIVATQGGESVRLLYTAGKDFLRVETSGSDRPNPIDIVDLKSGALTIVFPHNRSFVRMKSAVAGTADPGQTKDTEPRSVTSPVIPTMPPIPTPPGGLPPGVGPPPFGIPSGGPNIGAGRLPALPNPAVPAMPPMPMIPSMSEKVELKSTGKKDNILGYPCEQFEVKSRGETMEIWATDKLLPFQPYVRSQGRRFGPPVLEEQWTALMAAKKLFPLRAILHSDGESVRSRFEVQSIKPEKIEDKDGKPFQPPSDYTEIEPPPF